MPGLNVLDDDGELQCFSDANVWHVDDRGQLHLNQDNRPVASFAKDRWQAVASADVLEKSRPAHRCSGGIVYVDRDPARWVSGDPR